MTRFFALLLFVSLGITNSFGQMNDSRKKTTKPQQFLVTPQQLKEHINLPEELPPTHLQSFKKETSNFFTQIENYDQYQIEKTKSKTTSRSMQNDWVPKQGGITPDEGIAFIGISAVDENIAWGISVPAGGPSTGITSRKVTRTVDGGQTWITHSIPIEDNSLQSLSIFAKDELTAWVGMNSIPDQTYGRTYKTTDGGITWYEQPVLRALGVAIHFWDDLEGFAVGSSSADEGRLVFFRTADGGFTWKPCYDVPLMDGEFNWLSNFNNHIEVVGDNAWTGTRFGRVVKTSDRGRTWQVYDTPIPAGRGLSSIAFKDELNGIAVSSALSDGPDIGGLGYRTMDGGLTWQQMALPSDILGIEAVPNSGGAYLAMRAASLSSSYLLSKDNGMSWERFEAPLLLTMDMVSPTVGWAGGIVPLGGLYRWEGEPLQFQTVTPPALYTELLDDAIGLSPKFWAKRGAIDPGPAGEGVIWDFSDFVPDGFNFGFTWVERADAIEPDAFPEATHFGNTNYGSTIYLKSTETKAEGLGQLGPFQQEFLKPDLIFNYPHTYGSTSKDYAVLTFNGGIPGAQIVERVADGYGTLILPQGRLENVLRTKSIIERKQTNPETGEIICSKIVEYYWNTTDFYGEPLLISIDESTVNGETSTFSFASMDLTITSTGHNIVKDTLLVGTLLENFDNNQPETWEAQGIWQVDSTQALSNEVFEIPIRTGLVAAIRDNITDDLLTKGKLISPSIQLNAGKTYQLNFDSYFPNGGAPETAEIWISTDGKGTWTNIHNIQPTQDWAATSVSIPDTDLGSTINIAFYYNDEGFFNQGWAIDNVELIEMEGVAPAVSTWIPQGEGLLPAEFIVFDLHVVDENTVWGIAFDGNVPNQPPPVPSDHLTKVVKTTDGGTTWIVQDIEETIGTISFDIHAFDENKVWISTQDFATGGKGLWITTDGGENWTQKMDEPAGGVWVYFFNEMEGIGINAASMSRTIDGGETWTAVSSENIPAFGEGEFTIVQSGSNSLTSFGDHLWFGTSAGNIYHSADKGQTWTASPFPVENSNVWTVAFKDELNGIAVSSLTSSFSPQAQTLVAATTDGGQTWDIASQNDFFFHNVTFVKGSENTYIGSSVSNALTAISTDGGSNWEIIDNALPYGTIQFDSPNVGWVTNWGNDGTSPIVLKYPAVAGLQFPLVDKHTINNPKGLAVYPMPFEEQINIELPNSFLGDIQLQVVDVTGRIWVDKVMKGQSFAKQDLSTLPSGVYLLKLINEEYEESVKIIKQ